MQCYVMWGIFGYWIISTLFVDIPQLPFTRDSDTAAFLTPAVKKKRKLYSTTPQTNAVSSSIAQPEVSFLAAVGLYSMFGWWPLHLSMECMVGHCLLFCLIYIVVKQRYPRRAVCCIALTLLRCRFSLRRPPPRIARPKPLAALSRGSWDQGLKKYFICLDFHFTILGSHWSVEHLRKARRDHRGRCCHWIEYDTEYKLVIKIFPMSWRDTQLISIINLLRPLWRNLSKTLNILRLGCTIISGHQHDWIDWTTDLLEHLVFVSAENVYIWNLDI